MLSSAIATRLTLHAGEMSRHPRLLTSESDPFAGLNILKVRYASGRRPSQDMEGWALSWLLTGQKDFAERALAEMRNKQIASGKPSNS